MAASYKFLQEVPSKLEIQCKKGMHFSFDFGWYSIILILFVKNKGLGGRLLNGQNSLSVAKTICRKSPKGNSLGKHEFFKNPIKALLLVKLVK